MTHVGRLALIALPIYLLLARRSPREYIRGPRQLLWLLLAFLAVGGGFMGVVVQQTIQKGVARGVFSK